MPEVDNGDRGIGVTGGGIPFGHVAVERLDDGSFRTRPTGEVVGWRVLCDCYLYPNSGRTKVWASEQLWTRVPSQLQHNPRTFRIYASDENVEDVDRDETHNAAHALWRAEHIDELDAAGVIKGALAAVHAAEEQLDNAVLRARQASLSWARIGEAANMSAQGAHERWAAGVRSSAGQ